MKKPAWSKSLVGAAVFWVLWSGMACAKTQAPVAREADTAAPASRAGGGGQDAAIAHGGVALVEASFDCKRATTNVERLICASPALSRLDGEVAAAFKQAQDRYLHPKLLRDLQRSWLRDTRNQASSVSELEKSYSARLKELQEDIEGGKEEVRGELAWRMMVAGRTKDIVMPVITRWRNAAAMARINAALTKMASDMGCPDEPEEGAPPYDFWLQTAVTYAEHDIFSVDIHSGWYCGGPYPTNNSNSSTTFDLRTGAVVAFETLFANYERDNDALLRVIFGEQVANAEGDDVLTIGLIQGHPLAFSFHDDGLHVQPDFPHVIEALADEATAPYAKLQKFAARRGLLARIKE